MRIRALDGAPVLVASRAGHTTTTNRHIVVELQMCASKTCASTRDLQSRLIQARMEGFGQRWVLFPSEKNRNNKKLSVSKIASLQSIEHEIIRIDNTLEKIHELFPRDHRVCVFSARVSDALFELEQALHGLNIQHFTGSFEDPWINLEEEERNDRRRFRPIK